MPAEEIQSLLAKTTTTAVCDALMRKGKGGSNGVVVIPAGMELEVLREAESIESRDQEAAKRILSGAGLLETMRSLGRA